MSLNLSLYVRQDSCIAFSWRGAYVMLTQDGSLGLLDSLTTERCYLRRIYRLFSAVMTTDTRNAEVTHN